LRTNEEGGVLGEQRLHASRDGGRDLAVELLVNDGLQQGVEDALRGLLLQIAGAGARDDAGEFAVNAGKMFAGGGVIEFLGHGQ
jgi:hypothetical protein